MLTLWIAFLVIPVSAQDVVNAFVEKYTKDESLEIVSIGKKMFEMMGTLSSDNPDLMEVIKGLENIRIVSSKDPDLSPEYYKTAQELLSKSKGFEEILSSKENDEQTIVVVKESKDVVKELVLITNGAKGFSMIALNGKINIKTLAKCAGTLNIKGLEKLGSVTKNS